MQDKLDRLVDILNTIKSPYQKKYALKLLSEITGFINKQDDEIKAYISRGFLLPPGEVDSELDKYILILKLLNFTQDNIRLLNFETLKFICENKKSLLRIPGFTDLYKIQNWLMMFEFEYDRMPEDSSELKEFIKNETKD